MADSLGEVLKSVREAAGYTVRGLADRVHYSKSEIGMVETGQRRCRPELAAACDTLLGTTPLLAVLAGLDDEEPAMRRRALLTTAAAVTATAGLAGAAALADLVRHGLDETTGERPDWDQVVADYSRRLVTDPSPTFGAGLLAQLMIARQVLADSPTDPDVLRGAAMLGQLYGLWRGNQADVAAAHGWYRTAATLADRSADTSVRVYVRARTASRAVFEGLTVDETLGRAEQALALSAAPSAGVLEAHSAVLHVHALTGRVSEARAALGRMWDTLDRLDDGHAEAGRVLSFDHYLECRLGSETTADLAWRRAEPVLRATPVWWREGQVYYGLSLVRHGDVAGGVDYALSAVRALPTPVHTVGMAVSDLLRCIPAGYRSDSLNELVRHAASTPGPWVTVQV
ncbi:helix-turn-helix domain-containing protein [Micromonospora chalcea]|uniref:helix-turn-helix domain-containing protein n=1 Tax=Micromonospora chalcea TaxID=1874 RepID=UPI0038193DBE